MTTLLRGVQHRTLLGVTVLILAVVCNVSAAVAQLGATRQTVSAQGQLKEEDLRFKVEEFLDFEHAKFEFPANNAAFNLGFRNDRVVYVQIPNRGYGFDAPKLAQYLATVKYFDEKQKPTDIIWRTDSRLGSLYPPLGEVRTDMVEVLKPSGVLARTVTFDTSSGFVTDVTPWRELQESTGISIPKTRSKFCYCFCLASRDGKAIAIVSNDGTRGTQSEKSLDSIEVMTPELFWDFVLRSIADSGPYGDSAMRMRTSYEGFFCSLVPADSWDKAHSYRMGLSIVRYAELSSAPMETVVRRFHELVKTHPAVQTAVAAPLLNSNFIKLGPESRKRHYELAGEIGDVGLIAEFMKKMPLEGEGKQQAVAALARIAERHQLEPPPLATAQISQIRDWAARVAKDK